MKDYLGNELGLGDEVVFVQRGYRNFWRGIITKMTPKTILITHARANIGGTETKQTPEQVIKVVGSSSAGQETKDPIQQMVLEGKIG